MIYKVLTVIFVACLLGAMTLGADPTFAQGAGAEDGANKAEDSADTAPPSARRGWTGSKLRFITEADYPPFNYRDEEGILIGFNIDLAKAICTELEVTCEIKTASWENLIPALDSEEADVVAASLAVSVDNLKRVDFTNRYFRMPARFASKKSYELDEMIPEEVEGERIGVLKGTAHEAYLKDFFYDAKIIPFETATAARNALRNDKISLLFGDGISLMFWVNGLDSGGCCTLRGGAFTEAKYFGDGVGLAVKKGNRALRETLNDALENIRKSGRFEEFYLRYFPLRFY